MRLRVLHNGHVQQKNPHWQMWIQLDGSLIGEVIGRHSKFRRIQSFQSQLSVSETTILFAEAASMRPHFGQREKICLPDDVMIEFKGDAEEFWYVVPLEQRKTPVVERFFRVLNQILEPYA